jgi:hypothetical protein
MHLLISTQNNQNDPLRIAMTASSDWLVENGQKIAQNRILGFHACCASIKATRVGCTDSTIACHMLYGRCDHKHQLTTQLNPLRTGRLWATDRLPLAL